MGTTVGSARGRNVRATATQRRRRVGADCGDPLLPFMRGDLSSDVQPSDATPPRPKVGPRTPPSKAAENRPVERPVLRPHRIPQVVSLPVLQEHVKAERERVIQEHRGEQLCLEALVTPRPKTRGDCANLPRPCPFVSCRHHLYLDVDDDGSVRFTFPSREPWELEETCALDVADNGETTLERVGELMNVTSERIRQIEGPLLRELREECKHLR